MAEEFTIRDYSSDEQFDLAKFMQFKGDVYDVIDSPFLQGVLNLPTVSYYDVNSGSREIDIISQSTYGTPFYVFLLQFYNGIFMETLPEGTRLNLFSLTDLNNLYINIANGNLQN
jgi:hypothetical protein